VVRAAVKPRSGQIELLFHNSYINLVYEINVKSPVRWEMLSDIMAAGSTNSSKMGYPYAGRIGSPLCTKNILA